MTTAQERAQRLADDLATTGERFIHHGFDVESSIALILTDDDRAHGRTAPQCGYSAENVKRAEQMVRDAYARRTR